MAKKSYSREDLFGDIHHYDEKGHEIGVSRRGFLGGYTNYDAKGKVIGRSQDDIFGDMTHYDTKGHVIGRSREGFLGDYTNYDARGHVTGSTHRSVWDANPDRLKTTGSVYRRSWDPPRIMDATSPASDSPAPAKTVSRPVGSAEGSASGHTRVGCIWYLLVGLVLVFFVFPVFLNQFFFALTEDQTIWSIDRIAEVIDDTMESLEEYEATYRAPEGRIKREEILDIQSDFRTHKLLLEICIQTMDTPPAPGYHRAWRHAQSAGKTAAQAALILSQWDRNQNGIINQEEIQTTNDELREILPQLEKEVERLKKDIERIEKKSAKP